MIFDRVLPPKSPLRSKAVWTAILGTLLGVYEALADQLGWPKIPEWVYVILGSAGVYSLRVARRPVEWGASPTAPAPQPAQATPPAPAAALPDASLTGIYPAPSWADDTPR